MWGWIIVKHWADLSLALSVWDMFKHCHTLGDAFNVLQQADDVQRLGIVAVLTISAGGIVGIGKTAAHGLRLAEGARRLPRLVRWLQAKRRKARTRRHAGGPSA